jgi:hypothetical protein
VKSVSGVPITRLPLRVSPDGHRRHACRTPDELRLDIGEPNLIRPAIDGQGGRAATVAVAAEDHDAEDAGPLTSHRR